MKRIFQIFVTLFFLASPLVSLAQDDPSNDRSSTFVSGAVDPTEAFGTIEGPVLLAVGLAVLALTFALLFVANRTQNKNGLQLDQVEKLLLPGGNTDAS